MKKIIQYIGIACLFCLSFIYTEKAVTAVKEVDPIMISIKENIDKYKKDSIDAKINEDEIIPGKNGCKIDIDRSYNNMRKYNVYSTSLLKFKEIKPNISISNNYDKYIVMGDMYNNSISLIMKVYNKNNINQILKILKEKNIKINFFIDSIFIEENSEYLRKMSIDNEIYNSGINGKYEEEDLKYTNSLINSFTNNKSKYCINIEKNNEYLKVCSKNKMFTIKPNIVVNNSNYILEKNNIVKGNMVYFDSNNIDAFINTLNYLNKKGFEIVLLSELLSEDGC